MSRVAVFIDYQNVYMRARDSFGTAGAPSRVGQVVPRRVGELLVRRGHRVDSHRVLTSVLVARGMPSSERSPVGDAAAKRQVKAWRAQSGVTVVTRPVQYVRVDAGRGAKRLEAREKGIDVVLAVEMLLGAQCDDYDVAVLFSADTDLIPAIDAVRSIGKRCEVAAWRPPGGFRSALRVRVFGVTGSTLPTTTISTIRPTTRSRRRANESARRCSRCDRGQGRRNDARSPRRRQSRAGGSVSVGLRLELGEELDHLDDYVEIAETHRRLEDEAILRANRYLFVDTNAVTTMFFSHYYDGDSLPALRTLAADCRERYRHHIVCAPDIPFEQDGWRDNDAWRARMHGMVLHDLAVRDIGSSTVTGPLDDRVDQVRAILSGQATLAASRWSIGPRSGQ